MTPTAVFDLDKVLLGGDATTLFLRGRLRRAPQRALPALLAAPVLLPGAAVPGLRPLSARALTRLTVGGRSGDDVAALAEAYRDALARVPEAAVGDAIACVRAHRAAGARVVVATGCEVTLARGYLTAIGLGDLHVAGSSGQLWPPRSARAMGEAKVRMLVAGGYPPPWTVVYSDSASDLPLFAGTPRPVVVNAGPGVARQVALVLGRPPETVTWR